MKDEKLWFDKILSFSILCICFGAIIVCCFQMFYGIKTAKESARKAEIYQNQIIAGLQDSNYRNIKSLDDQHIGDGFSYSLILGDEKELGQRNVTVVIKSDNVNNVKVEWKKTVLLKSKTTKDTKEEC